MIHSLLRHHYKLILPVIVLGVAFYFQDILKSQYNNYFKTQYSSDDKTSTFTVERLSRYNGILEKKMYMAVLGIVYDVSKGKQHYAEGSPYHYFVGKDGSRALVTGDFKDETEQKDHVLDLPCKDILSLLQWRESLKKKYKKVGLLSGRYYEVDGKSTPYSVEFDERIQICLDEKESNRNHDLQYPPCNVAWSETEGTKVWCTKTSGGISRSWVGVPRQLYSPGDQRPKCVCINTDLELDSSKQIKEYENCSNTSVTCFVQS